MNKKTYNRFILNKRERVEDLGRLREKLSSLTKEIDDLLPDSLSYDDFKKKYNIMGVETEEMDYREFQKIPAYFLFIQLNEIQQTLSDCLCIACGDDEDF